MSKLWVLSLEIDFDAEDIGLMEELLKPNHALSSLEVSIKESIEKDGWVVNRTNWRVKQELN